jgi:hypothetical protein
MLGSSSTELIAVAAYVEPQNGPAPALDENGNLTLPNSSGLVSLPLTISPDAAGTFTVSLDADPELTGVAFATGLPAPDDVGVHPVGIHLAGVLTVFVGILGDMDGDLDVDFDDIDDFVLGLTDPMAYENLFGVPAFAKGDTDRDGDLDFDDIGGFVALLTGPASEGIRAVPEPSVLVVIFTALAGLATARGIGSSVGRVPR